MGPPAVTGDARCGVLDQTRQRREERHSGWFWGRAHTMHKSGSAASWKPELEEDAPADDDDEEVEEYDSDTDDEATGKVRRAWGGLRARVGFPTAWSGLVRKGRAGVHGAPRLGRWRGAHTWHM